MSSPEVTIGGLVGTRWKPALSVEVTDGIAIITFDLPNESVNKLNRAVKDEFVALVSRIERDPTIVGAVLISGKPDVWIAGADIEEFLQLKTAADAERLSRDGQMLLDSLERLRVPLIAAIHGACLGGGLETALACRYRIATDHPKTILGLPEVQLGLIPGAGGTQRLPRRIGLTAALDMILTGKQVRVKKALDIGLIDEMVHPSILRSVAIQRAREVAEGKRKSERRTGGVKGLFIDGNPAGRAIVLRKAREQTLAKSRGHYPALIAAIDVVGAGYEKGPSHGFREESRRFGEMAMTDVSRQLIFLFFATNELKKDPGVDPSQHPDLPVSARSGYDEWRPVDAQSAGGWDAPFDVVVCADVLEHFAKPESLLERIREWLKPGGTLFVSLPNVANVTVRAGLLFGRFQYADRGILDRTHLTFFTRRTAVELLERQGFRVRASEPTAMPYELAIPALGRGALAGPARGFARASALAWPTLFGYQFVLEAERS